MVKCWYTNATSLNNKLHELSVMVAPNSVRDFRKIAQYEGVTFDSFVARVTAAAVLCDFANFVGDVSQQLFEGALAIRYKRKY